MTNPLADIENLCFFDFETRAEPHVSASDGNVKTAGTYRYANRSFVIVSTWAIGNGPVFDVSLDAGFDGDWMLWDDMPRELREFHKRVEQGEAWYAAFNAGFDKAAWNHGTYNFPRLGPDMVIDVMAQSIASNLPPSLEGASKAIGRRGKQDDGKALIALFCDRKGGTPQSHPTEWARFKSYGLRDTDELREVYRHTRPLELAEWEDYWVSEAINERGVSIDLEFVKRADMVAGWAVSQANDDLTRLTGGVVTRVTQAQRIAEWLYDNSAYAEATEILVKEWNEDVDPEDGKADVKVGKLSLAKDRVERLLAFYEALPERTEADDKVMSVIQARAFAGSTSPAKFGKMLAQHDRGRLRGQYVFNGAAQTGRFSSKGVQTHNLIRASLKDREVAAIEMINDLEIPA